MIRGLLDCRKLSFRQQGEKARRHRDSYIAKSSMVTMTIDGLGGLITSIIVVACSSFVLPKLNTNPSTRLSSTGKLKAVSNVFDFEKLKSVERRLSSIEREAPTILSAYYEPHLKSFSAKPGSEAMSVTSTCFALGTIFAIDDRSTFEDYVNLNLSSPIGEDVSSKINLRKTLKALLRANWREDDLFQVPLLLKTLLSVDKGRDVLSSGMDEELCYRVKKLISATIANRPRRRNGLSQPISNYIEFLITDSLATLLESTPSGGGNLGGLTDGALPDGAERDTLIALTRCVEVSYNDLCRQLAFRAAGDTTNFDSIRLAYALLTYVRASTVMAGLGTAGRGTDSGKIEMGTAMYGPNKKLVKSALGAFFDEQNRDGLWPAGQPIFKSFRRTGVDVGNAFVFAVDTVGTLLRLLQPEMFRPYLNELESVLGWIEEHKTKEVIADYCDQKTLQCYGRPITGWVSPHMTVQTSSPNAWSTAQTLTCAIRVRKLVKQLLHDDVLEEFNGVNQKHDGIKLAAWDRLLDTDLGNPTDDCSTLKCVLNERMIEPRSTQVKFGLAYSAILFGPPGTAKTTICEALAQRLGWDFLVIDTACFLEDGLTNVASRIRYVFERLQSLNQCVILFDEIEEFCLDRENKGLGMESRMLTTAMLTAINDLRRAKLSIFFLATNRLRAFDSAIIRPGRFDLQLFVGTPNLEARVIQLRNQLESVAVKQKVKDEAEEAFRSYISSVWSEDVMFFNYLEGLQFASACSDVIARGDNLTEERMSAILKAQATVMTVRGAVREEYKESMGLSRL